VVIPNETPHPILWYSEVLYQGEEGVNPSPKELFKLLFQVWGVGFTPLENISDGMCVPYFFDPRESLSQWNIRNKTCNCPWIQITLGSPPET